MFFFYKVYASIPLEHLNNSTGCMYAIRICGLNGSNPPNANDLNKNIVEVRNKHP